MDKNINQIPPLVSVVMAVYNGEKYLHEAIASVLTQTFVNFEFIIINDGSSDNSLSIINSYSDKRIKLINNNGNKGLIYSLNSGIDASSGKYIARMDADDICLPERLKKQFEYLEFHPNIGVIGCDYLSFSEKHSSYIKSIYKSGEIKSFLLFTATMCHPTLMLRKQILIENKLHYSETAKHVEDYDLWCRLILVTDFYNLNELLFKYRDHPHQVSHHYRAIQIQNSQIIQENYLMNLGFSFSESELQTHFLISSNSRIKLRNNLIDIEKWLMSLISQNTINKSISDVEFKTVIAKVWLDCCGNTSLGLWSYVFFQKSKLRKITNDSKLFNSKLLVKCLVRWLK